MERFTGLVRKCIEDYDMIQEGDRIAVGVSGGKDSLALLCALADLRRYYHRRFSISAITVDSGFEGMNFSAVGELCRSIDVPYTLIETDIRQVVFDERRERNPCSLCVKMRKGILNERLKQDGISKIALGHHRDDAVETFFMSLFYEGRLHCFSPVTYMDRTGVTQIRPLLYADEDMIVRVSKKLQLPVVKSTCPLDSVSKRAYIKGYIEQMEKQFPDIRKKVFGAMQRMPLDGWGVVPHPKRKNSSALN